MMPRRPGERPRDVSKPLEALTIKVDAPREGERLDKALTTWLTWRSRTSIVRLIDDGRITVNGEKVRSSFRLRWGDEIKVAIPPRPDPILGAPVGPEFRVLYEDRWMVVVDKPAGMAVHPAGRTMAGTLIHFLHRRYRHDNPAHDVVPRLMHRIDRETSGIVAVGLDDELHSLVTQQFENREVEKTYLAVVHGCPEPNAGTIDFGIGPDVRSPVRLKLEARRDGSGLAALTHYRVVRADRQFALLELEPKTGRTHQLRVHLSAIGHPLVGDKIYGPDAQLFLDHLAGRLDGAGRAQLLLDRHALHSHRLRFYHPFLQQAMTVESPLPQELARLVAGED